MSRRSRFRRPLAASLGCLLLVTTTTGCYEYVPMSSRAAADAQRIDVLLNDRGRSELVNRLGPDVLSLEGTLVSRTDSALTVRVLEVTYVNRSVNQWSGEELVIGDSQVRDVRAKRLSKLRTGIATGLAAGAGLIFILTRSINVGGGGEQTQNPTPPTNQQ